MYDEQLDLKNVDKIILTRIIEGCAFLFILFFFQLYEDHAKLYVINLSRFAIQFHEFYLLM